MARKSRRALELSKAHMATKKINPTSVDFNFAYLFRSSDDTPLIHRVMELFGKPLARAFERHFKTYTDPHSGIYYTVPYDAAKLRKADRPMKRFEHRPGEAIAPPQPRPDLGCWPTPEELAHDVPTVGAFCTAIEDAPLLASWSMIALSASRTPLPPKRRDAMLAHVFKGMVGLWEAPGRTGFICRGFLPQSKAFSRQTSADQTPYYLLALQRFQQSGLATEAQKKKIIEITRSAMAWLEACGWNYNLWPCKTETAHPNMVTAPTPLTVIKFLGLFALAHQITGDDKYLKLYHHYRDEGDRWRLKIIPRLMEINHYAIFGCQMLLRSMAQIEDAPAIADIYNQARWWQVWYICHSAVLPLPALGSKVRIHLWEPRNHRPDWRPGFARARSEMPDADPLNSWDFWATVRKHTIEDDQKTRHAKSGRSNAMPPPGRGHIVYHAEILQVLSDLLAIHRLATIDRPKPSKRWAATPMIEGLVTKLLGSIDFDAGDMPCQNALMMLGVCD